METILNHPLFLPLTMTVVILALAPLTVAYIVLLERKVLADIQVRLGPMRVGPHGLLQTIADAVKMLLKEDIVPRDSNQWMFRLAPAITFFTALTSLTVIPFSEHLRIADLNVGLLLVAAMSSVGIIGLVLGGWASNSHYSLLGGLRAAAQMVSYEVALGLAMIAGVMSAGTLSLVKIVLAQQERQIWFAFDNFGLMLIPFMVFVIAAIAETNRAPFDLPEAESELVAGYHTEYSGFRWGVYMLSEYIAMMVMGSLAITLFMGGWLRPFPNVGWLDYPLNFGAPALLFGGVGVWCFPASRKLFTAATRMGLIGVGVVMMALGALFLVPAFNASIAPLFWFFLKLGLIMYGFIWLRGTFPRYRYDQLMDVGWKVLIPVALGAIFVNAIAGMLLRG
jgi:NADH-quinone oxidoreductase subunit H